MNKHKPYDGFFITFEGGEGAGKTTLITALCHELKKRYPTVCTREPGGTPLGDKIRALLLDSDRQVKIGEKAELMLFLAARTQNIEEVIMPALRQGSIVLCDRFNDSSIAYQGCARHLGMHYVEELTNLACDDLVPDCTFFLDLDPEEGLLRVATKRKQSSDRLEDENLQFHREVRQGFLHLADKDPCRIKIINATQSEEAVFKEALEHINALLK